MGIITLTSDFAVQSRGCGTMEAVAYDINPDAKVIHFMHGLPSYDLFEAARAMETVTFIPQGFHVCVVDPGVGTKRKPIIIKTKRGDYLIGPDNGCLISAARLLGFEKAVHITNEKYMRHPVSYIFHGRDIFTPAAAYLSKGVEIEDFGEELKFDELFKAPYEEAVLKDDKIESVVINKNKFGSVHLNILHEEWDRFVKKGDKLELTFDGKTKIEMPVVDTFGEVEQGKPLIMKDDYGRVEVALNMEDFSNKYEIKVGVECVILKKK